MKYTHQIIYGNVNIESLVSSNRYLRPATVVMLIPVALFGVILFTLALPVTASMDFGRYVKLQYFRQVRIYHRVSYINEVTKSLSSDKNERREACKRLIALI